jgi:uncharacterized protein (DUF2147 family)
MRSAVCAAVAMTLVIAHQAAAQGPLSPVGAWKTVDDKSGKVKSIVRIWEDQGKLFGRIEKLFRDPGEDRDPVCVPCQGQLKYARVIGMTILTNLSRDGDVWSGGRIVDPENGKSYSCSLKVTDGGKKLKVRGYIGFSLLGRTQTWLKAE